MKKIMVLLLSLTLFSINSFAQVAQKVRSNTGTVDLQNQILTNVQFIYTTDGKNYLDADYSNSLRSITFGSEGFRLIGALGNYTLADMLKDTVVRGASRDLPAFSYTLAPSSNLVVNWTTGDVYSPEVGYYHLIVGTNTLTDNAVNYAYWTPANPNVISWTTGTRAPATNCIALGTFSCAFGMIINAGTGTVLLATSPTITVANPASTLIIGGPISGAFSITKSGLGTLKLTATNTFSGTTYIQNGSLKLGVPLTITNNIVLTGGTLDTLTNASSMGTLKMGGDSTINIGASGTIAFLDSSAINWNGTLKLTGGFVSGSSLRFGTSNKGLTETQLTKMYHAVYGSRVSLDSNGYVVFGTRIPNEVTRLNDKSRLR